MNFMKNLYRTAFITSFCLLAVGCEQSTSDEPAVETDVSEGISVPGFQVDPFWPKTLPNEWLIGRIAGVAGARHFLQVAAKVFQPSSSVYSLCMLTVTPRGA